MTHLTKESVQYDILIRAPEAWEDGTVVMFTAPPTAPDRFPAKLLVTRHQRPSQSDLADVAKRALDQFAKRMDGFELVASRPSRLADRAAHSAQFHFRGPKGRVTQQQTWVGGMHGTVLCITTAALFEEYAAFEPVFREILLSVRLPMEP
jgi:hypothetical protein